MKKMRQTFVRTRPQLLHSDTTIRQNEAEPVLSDDREADEPDAYEGDAGVQAAGLGAKEYGVRTSLAPIL